MAIELRKTGISAVGDVPWGTHFCSFYNSKEDLLDILVPYFKVGLENNEFCLWVISNSELLTAQEATSALRSALPDFDRYVSGRSLEIVGHDEWFLVDGVFDLHRVANRFKEKLDEALARGYTGMRVNGSPAWLQRKSTKELRDFEEELDQLFPEQRILASCTYPLATIKGDQIFDTVRTHQFAIARRQGEWEVIETPELWQARAEIERLNQELKRFEERPSRQPLILRYGVAILSVAVALIITLWMRREIGQPSTPIVGLFLCAVMFSAWFGGVRPGLLAIALSFLAVDYYFVPRMYSLVPEIREIPRLIVFAVSALFVGLLSAAQRSAAESLRRARDILDETIQELRRTNQALRTENAERKRSEEALRRSEDRIRLIIDTIPTMAWTVRPDGTVDFLNQRWMDYSGLSLEQYVEEPTGPIHPEDIPRVVEKWRANMAVGEPYEAEMRMRRADGEYHWFLVRTAPLRDEQGNLVKWYGVSIDIEDRKHAEALLHAKEQEFRAIVENAPDQIIRYDREFRRTYVNPAVAHFYGLPAETLIGKPLGSDVLGAGLDDVKESELTQVRQRIAAVFETGKCYDYELTWTMPTGRSYFSIRLFPELDLNGSVVNVLAISRDITERRTAAEELKKEKEILEKIFDNIPVLIGFVGEDGRVKLVNPEWERTMGWTLRELQEQNVDIFAEAYPNLPYRQKVLDFVAASTGEWVDLKIKVRDGRVIDAACAIVNLSDGTRVAIAQDITERKGAEERIKATSEQLRALSTRLQSAKEEEDIRIAREIHDEMGSTLTSLRWELERLDKTISEAEDWSQLQALRAKIENMMRLTDSTIGSMRRIASELRPSILDDLGLPEAIEWQTQQFQSRTGIVSHCDCSLENLDFDPEQSTAIFRIFQEALTNVLSHARATRVEVAAREDDGEFVLTISDNGRGITEHEKSGRLSLGILGMRERAHLIGAEIEISGIDGRGTVVTVRVPISGKSDR